MNVAEIPQAEKKYILADILKKRNHEQALGEDRVRKIAERRLSLKQKKDDYVGPESFVKKYRKQQKAFSHLKKTRTSLNKKSKRTQASPTEFLYDIPLNRTLVVVRIRGIEDISDQQKKLFQWFKLKRVNNAVFIKSTPKAIKYLKLLENYIAFGLPTRQTVSQLLMKRAHVVKDSEIVQLTGNDMIEQALGLKNLICTEDLIEEICTTGANFMDVTKFLCTFKLNHPKNSLKSGRIKKPFRNGGEWGYREEKINDLLEQMI